MKTTTTNFKSVNRKDLSELYFKAVGEKEIMRRDLERGQDNDGLLSEYLQVNSLVSDLRSILGTVIKAVP